MSETPTEVLTPSAMVQYAQTPASVRPDATRRFTEVEPTPANPEAELPQVITQESTQDKIRAQRAALARTEAREDAMEGPKTLGRIMQVLLAICAPIAAIALVVRVVASPVFLWLEYRRPGFPADEFGFSTAERTNLGSYGVDYLFNGAGTHYLSTLQFEDGGAVFTAGEVSHMADVKSLMILLMVIGFIAGVIALVAAVVLYRTRKGGIRRGLFAGSIWLIIAMVVLAVIGLIGWDAFFTGFHGLFFADGTWTFYTSDSLIRLYPEQFWIDAALAVALLLLIAAVITLVLTWPSSRRRMDARQAQIFLLSRKNYWAE